MKEVLDTRFLIEHYYATNTEIRKKTSRKLRELVQHKKGIIPTIVISETIQTICNNIGKEEAENCYQALLTSGLQIINLTTTISKQAGLIKCQRRNIPMGDCIIAATAIANQARILTDDPHYDTIRETKRTWI
ncbi:MAG TPA: PIN domain-containing protein [candidate division Zixibacteria bacterium]|nr:PIN domain-containing protein [candidate division Zixibacteria bacterium]